MIDTLEGLGEVGINDINLIMKAKWFENISKIYDKIAD